MGHQPIERVVANAAGNAVKTFTTPELPDGAYAVIGECLSLSTVANPQTTMPQIVLVGGPLGGSSSVARPQKQRRAGDLTR